MQCFHSPRLVDSPRLRKLSALQFNNGWRENNWFHTFPKIINAIWNAIDLIQDLNPYWHVLFLRSLLIKLEKLIQIFIEISAHVRLIQKGKVCDKCKIWIRFRTFWMTHLFYKIIYRCIRVCKYTISSLKYSHGFDYLRLEWQLTHRSIGWSDK